MSIEIDEAGAWIFDARVCGKLPETALSDVLEWILQQLHFGCGRLEADTQGQLVTLILGKDAAIPFDEPVLEAAVEHDQRRHLALSFAGVLAAARERGVEPEYLDMAETARLKAEEGGYMNTDFYYAFELDRKSTRLNSSH